MPTYAYEGKARDGRIKKGVLNAQSETDARMQLRKLQIVPTLVKPHKKRFLENLSAFQPRIKEKDVVIVTRQFSTMIDAGLPVVQCLEILAGQQEKKNFKNVLANVKEIVEGGATLTEALSRYPNVFNNLYTSLVSAGETGGVLDIVLSRLAGYMEKVMRLKAKVKGAMVYPTVIVAIAVLVMAVILIFVIPVFSKMFSEMGASLPLPTQVVVGLSYLVKDNVLYLVIAGLVAAILFRQLYKSEAGKKIFDRLALRLPIFGPLLRKVAVAKFSRTLSTMLSSGVPILESLDIVAKTAGNKTVETAILRSKKAISEGKTIAEPLGESGVFPNMVLQMIGVGEATGELDSMLQKIADFYDEEVDNAVSALTALLEPMMMVFLGGTIGGLVISMYLPIFQMAAVMAGG
jgi:type IV pilus assembly protein PilC